MVLTKTEVSKAVFKNCKIEKDEDGVFWIVEDLGDKGIESRNLEEIVSEVFGEEPFSLTLQSKLEL